MNKVNGIKTLNIAIFVLGILAILAGFLLLPKGASAQAAYVTPYNATNYDAYPVKKNTAIVVDPYTPPAPYYPGAQSTTVNQSETVTTTENTYNTETNIEEESVAEQKFEELSGNAVFGASSFRLGLIHWVFLAILILLIVILVRKIFGAEQRYHSTPLKHA